MNRFVKLGPYLASLAVTSAIFVVFITARTPIEDPPAKDVATAGVRRADELERRRLACALRKQMRDQIIEEVIADRLTLFQAATRFQELNESDPHFCWGVLRSAYPGATDHECCCRQIIAFVQIDLEDDPTRARAVVERLERQLDGYMAKSTGHYRDFEFVVP
jgi:hypothetical protein